MRRGPLRGNAQSQQNICAVLLGRAHVSIEPGELPLTGARFDVRPARGCVPQSPCTYGNAGPRIAAGNEVHPEVRGWNRLSGRTELNGGVQEIEAGKDRGGDGCKPESSHVAFSLSLCGCIGRLGLTEASIAETIRFTISEVVRILDASGGASVPITA